MPGSLSEKVALVTGAASGIGRAVALRLAGDGAAISAVDMNIEGARNVVAEISARNGRAIALQCDVSREEDVHNAVGETQDKLGAVGVLVNCAGFAGGAFLADMPTEEWRRMFEVHCDGTFFFCRAVVKSMAAGDRIVNISSIDGIEGQYVGTHYAAAKGAVIALTKSLALEVAWRDITVNAIAPGVVRTPMGQMLIEIAPDFDKDIPLQRYGEPEDIAEVAAFLASPGASYITGQTIVVDGGITLASPVFKFVRDLMGPG